MNWVTRTLTVMGSILGLFATSGNSVAQPEKAKTATTFIGTLPAEPPARVAIVVEGDTFLVTYGDGVSDVNIANLLAFHRSHGKLATVTTVRPVSRFGLVEIGAGGRVDRFAEKPQVDGWMSAGFFVFERPVLDYLTSDETVLEREPLERLAADGQLMAYRHEGFFFAMDTYREYRQLNDLWASGSAPWKVWR